MNFFESEDDLKRGLKEFSALHKPHLALVSLEVPLISNLAIWSNIALIPQYHQNLPWPEAKARTLDLLSRFDLTGIAEMRNPTLTTHERFCVMLLRAAMVRGAVLVIDRPFQILTGKRDRHFVTEALRKIDDLIAEVHIFDYSWEKQHYWISHDTED